MERYYRILGLEPGASKADIKKAYFHLIRQHSPEKDPEEFQKIRNAYEQLNKEEETQDALNLPEPSDAFAQKMLEQIRRYRDGGYEEGYRDTCEEAVRRYPDEILFRFLLVQAYRGCGNSGKAVKAAEEIVMRQPGNKFFYRELAYACEDRGYVKKAYAAYENAYTLGCRDLDFMLAYARNCEDNDEPEKGLDILLETMRSGRQWKKDNAPELVEGISGILALSKYTDKSRLTECLGEISKIVDRYGILLKEYLEGLVPFLALTSAGESDGGETQQLINSLWDSFFALADGELRTKIKHIRQRGQIMLLHMDSRFDDPILLCAETYMLLDEEETGYREKKFFQLDSKLCMIEERESMLPQLEILRTEYPAIYEKIGEIVALLEQEDQLEEQKRRMLKDYLRLSDMLEDGERGLYAERHPDKMISPDVRLVSDGSTGIPYVREGVKIGRNDPCPCGSGKKYKNCCMRKGQ